MATLCPIYLTTWRTSLFSTHNVSICLLYFPQYFLHIINLQWLWLHVGLWHLCHLIPFHTSHTPSPYALMLLTLATVSRELHTSSYPVTGLDNIMTPLGVNYWRHPKYTVYIYYYVYDPQTCTKPLLAQHANCCQAPHGIQQESQTRHLFLPAFFKKKLELMKWRKYFKY
jgi:hypothetical protein